MARLTLEQIWLSATRFNPWRRNYSNSPKRQINQIVPFLGTKTVLISASFWGLTEKTVHSSNILFMNCEIIEERPESIVPEPVQENPEDTDSNNPNALRVPIKKTFGGVVNAEQNYSSATHFKINYQNKIYWIKKFDMKTQPVLIRCSCSDYYFCFSWANFINGIQFGGRAKPYIRKTKTYPPRNPQNIMGLCKHTSQMAQMLQSSGLAL